VAPRRVEVDRGLVVVVIKWLVLLLAYGSGRGSGMKGGDRCREEE